MNTRYDNNIHTSKAVYYEASIYPVIFTVIALIYSTLGGIELYSYKRKNT